jgi:hypothetical protein
MPIYINSFLLAKNGATWFLVEDKFVKGGLQVCETLTERDNINPANLKSGMLVYCTGTSTMYQLGSDLVTWSTFKSEPITHTHNTASIISSLGYTPESSANKGVSNGYASLDSTGKIPVAQLPNIALISVSVVSSESAMLSVSAQTGDVAVRTDINKSFILRGSNPAALSDWQELLSSGGSSSGINSISVATPLTKSGTTDVTLGIVQATASQNGFMASSDKSKLDSIAANANNYSHPTGDGNLHVPATGTSNNGKVLTAGSTAGSISWQTVSGSGSVTQVNGTGSVNGLTLTGSVTTSGSLTLGGSITSVSTSANIQMNSLGVGTSASGNSGDIRATGDIAAFYSDERLKNIIGNINNAVDKVMCLNGVYYTNNDVARKFGYTSSRQQVGVIAQEVEAILPEVVCQAPFDIGQNGDGSEYSISGEKYLTVKYEKLIPLLIEAIKEQQLEINYLKSRIGDL